MCNAWNHDETCDCGFGPPYVIWGALKIEKEKNWIDSVISCVSELKRGMKEVGFNPKEIEEAAYKYQEMPKKRVGLITWFQNILNQRKYVDISSTVKLETIPLFRLHLPKVDGAKIAKSRVVYRESDEEEKQSNWSFRIFGNGMGKTKSVSVSCSADVTAENGQCKMIFVKIPVRVTKVEVWDKNKFVNTFLRTEIDAFASEIKFHSGARKCRKSDCKKDRDLVAPPSDFFPLSTSGKNYVAVYTEAWRYASGRKITLGIKAFGIESEMSLNIFRVKELMLRFELPGGYDYLLRPLEDKNGIKWDVSKKGFQGINALNVHLGQPQQFQIHPKR